MPEHPDPHGSGAQDAAILAAFRRPALIVMHVAQMILGLALGIALIVKCYMLVFGTGTCAPDGQTLRDLIGCTPTLEIAARVLLAATGFRIAAFLFGARTRAVLEPMMLALCGVLLLLLSGLTVEDASWPLAAMTVTLMLGIGAIVTARTVLSRRDRSE